jgi:hypothetical protein
MKEKQRTDVDISDPLIESRLAFTEVLMPESRFARTGVGAEKVGTNQLIFMRSVWQCEMFSGIV